MRKLIALAALACLLVWVAPAGAALSLTNNYHSVSGDMRVEGFTVTFDSSYATGGEALTAATMGFHDAREVICEDTGGYRFTWDRANSKLLAYGESTAAKTIHYVDDDTPSGEGTLLFAVTTDGLHAYFESVNANNADSYFTLTDESSAVWVFDNNSATVTASNRYGVYLDDDATLAKKRLLIQNAEILGSTDLLIPTSAGDYIRLVYSATAEASPAVYFDDDEAVVSQRLYVSTDNSADGSSTTDPSVGVRWGEAAEGSDLSSVTVRITVFGM